MLKVPGKVKDENESGIHVWIVGVVANVMDALQGFNICDPMSAWL